VPAGSRPVRHGRNPGPRLARVCDGGRGWDVNEPMVLREWRKFAAEVARPSGRSGSEGRDSDGLGHGGPRRSDPPSPRAQRQPAEAAGWPAPRGEQGRHGRRRPAVRGNRTGHAPSPGINRGSRTPSCPFDGVAKTPTDSSDPWSFPILSAWPNLPVVLDRQEGPEPSKLAGVARPGIMEELLPVL